MDTFKDAKRAEEEMTEAYRVMEEEEAAFAEDSTRIGLNMNAARTLANRLANLALTP